MPFIQKRFNVLIHEVDGAEEEKQDNWVLEFKVLDYVRRMNEGDELVIQRVENNGGL